MASYVMSETPSGHYIGTSAASPLLQLGPGGHSIDSALLGDWRSALRVFEPGITLERSWQMRDLLWPME